MKVGRKLKGFRAIARKRAASRVFLCGHPKTKANTFNKHCKYCFRVKMNEAARERKKAKPPQHKAEPVGVLHGKGRYVTSYLEHVYNLGIKRQQRNAMFKLKAIDRKVLPVGV